MRIRPSEMKLTVRVPEMRHALRWRYLRTRSIVTAQLRRRTWATRLYRLAVKLDGRADTYIRIKSDTLRVLLPQPRFGPDLHHVRIASDGGEIIGGLTRDQLQPADLPTALLDVSQGSNWRIENLHFTGVCGQRGA